MIYTPATNVPSRDAGPLDSFDLASFLQYLYQRRTVTVIACVVAVAIAGAISFLLPKKYTATATILIEPPAGNDPRGATAVSPVYLESLKTYEHFASSDSLFQQALLHVQIRAHNSGIAIEALKRRVLKVSKPKDTKILEIAATLEDRAKAQQFARYIAEQTVALNRSLDAASVRELEDGAQVLVRTARSRLENARQARELFTTHEPITALEAELTAATDLKSRLDRDLLDAQVGLAAYRARSLAQAAGSAGEDKAGFRGEIAALEAEMSALQRQRQTLVHEIDADTALLEVRKHKRETLDKEVQTAQTEYDAAVTRNADIASSASFRGERLEIIDPGVVPERPSSPNIPLNLIVALLASGSASVMYLAARFSYNRTRLAAHAYEDEG